MSTTGTIGGVAVQIAEDGNFSIKTKLDERDQCIFTAVDTSGTAIFSKGQKVVITETVAGVIFSGYVKTAKRQNLVPQPSVYWTIDTIDNHYLIDKRTGNRTYANQYAGAIVADLYSRYMAQEGVLAQTAVQTVSSQADWNTGQLSNVVGGLSTGDGDLELISSDSLGATFNSAAQWNTGSLNNVGTGTQGDIALVGHPRNWDNGDKSNQTLYGNGSPSDSVSGGVYSLYCSGQNETRSRLDFAGTWGNGTIGVDLVLTSGAFPGFTWHTTSWTNNDSAYAYAVELTTTKIAIRKGSNGGSSSSSEIASTTFGTALSPGTYRVQVVMNGNTYSAYLNGSLYCSVTDSTYPSAGYIALRNRNGATSALNQQFDNFGVMSATSGTWTSPAQALDTVTNIAFTSISWQTTFSGGGTITVQTSTDNGSTWKPASNGGSIQGLTVGSSGAGKTLKIQVLLSTLSTGVLPDINDLVWTVSGGYLSTGTRSTAPLGIDTMARANQSGFGTSFDGQPWVKTGTGTDAIASNVGTITNTTGDCYEVLGSASWTDSDVTVKFSLSASTITAGAALRYINVNNWFRVVASTTQLIASKNIAGTPTTIATVSKTLSTGITYYLRFRLFGTSPATVQARVWQSGTLEPTTWDINTTT